MQTHKINGVALGAAFVLHLALTSTVWAQGSLTPPGAPGATMKTLSQIEPRTPISSVPFTINAPGSYYLTTNLVGVAFNSGIAIASGGVTLDLNGFALLGVPTSLGGIEISAACTNVTVRNGSISGWGSTGVEDNFFSQNVILERLFVYDNSEHGIVMYNSMVSDCSACNNLFDGMYAAYSTVRACHADNNGQYGIYVPYSTMCECQGDNNATAGLYGDHAMVRDCRADNNPGMGIYILNSTVSGCFASYNGTSGIFINGPDSQIIGNNCQNNNTNNSSAHAGIYINDNHNRVEDNHVNASGYAGILVVGAYQGNVIVRNTVSGNTTNNYVVSGNQVVGPLVTTFGTITNLNPWANFSY